MTGVPPSAGERLLIQSVSITENTVYVKSTGTMDVEIDCFLVKNQTGNVVLMQGNVTGDAKIPVSSEKTVTLGIDLSALPVGNYTLTIVSATGGNWVSPQFTVP